MNKKLLLVKEDREIETVEADTQPFHASSKYVEAQLYNENVRPIDFKESIEDSMDDWEDLSFGLFRPSENGTA